MNNERAVLEWPYAVAAADVVVNVTFKGAPLSKQRPRFTRKGGVYTPSQTRDYEDALAWIIKEALAGRPMDATGKYALRCIFYRPNRQRIDCDNLLKAVSDAATKQVWKDDSQVVEVIGRLILASDHPRAEILIHRAEDPAPRPPCPVCGREVVTYPGRSAIHCSMECWRKSKSVTEVCRECARPYELPQSLAAARAGFCSRSCAMKYHGRVKTTRNGPPTWKCRDCGGPVSRREYTHCLGCSMKIRGDPTSNYWQLRAAKGLAKLHEPRPPQAYCVNCGSEVRKGRPTKHPRYCNLPECQRLAHAYKARAMRAEVAIRRAPGSTTHTQERLLP